MYRYIIFDADNTILDFTYSEGRALERTLSEEAGIDFDLEVHLPLYMGINKEIWKEFENGGIDADELKIERFRRFFSELGYTGCESRLPDISSRYLTCLSESSVFISGAEQLLENLYGRVTMALVTNGLTRVQKPRFERAGLSRFFSTILISDELNMAKPDPGIFALACDNMGAHDKSEVLMVGDNQNSDIRGGNEFGIHTCWFNPHHRPREAGIIPGYEISKLEDFIDTIPLP